MENSEKLCTEAGIPQLALEKPPSAQKVNFHTFIITDPKMKPEKELTLISSTHV